MAKRSKSSKWTCRRIGKKAKRAATKKLRSAGRKYKTEKGKLCTIKKRR